MEHGDILFVLSIDCLGRNYTEIQHQWQMLTCEKGIEICVLDMQLLDTRREKELMRTFVADLALQILSFVVENERENIRKRQEQKIEAAKQRGVKCGEPEVVLPDDFGDMIETWERKELSLDKILTKCGVSRTTFYRRVRKYKIKKE